MVFDSEKEVNSLIKHDLGNILQVSVGILTTEGYKDNHTGKEEYRESMEEFAGALDAAVQRLDASYGLETAREDLEYIKEFETEEFHDDFDENVEKAKNLAGVATSYMEETEDDREGWIPVDDIFQSYEGEFDIEGYKSVNLRGDSSLNCVLSTLEDNSHRHGGLDVTPRIKAHHEINYTDEYELDHWNSVENREYTDHWSNYGTGEEYTLLYWDDGEGLEDEYQENPDKIFEKGEGNNSGMGLHLSKRIIESFGGEIEVLDDHPEIPDDTGIKLSITLPGTPTSMSHLSS